MITRPQLRPNHSLNTSNFSSSTTTVYTAKDFSGYTLQHLKAMYPNRWREAAKHFGVALPELTVEQIKQTAIDQQIWDFYPTTKAIADKMLLLAQIQPCHSVLEPSAGSGDLAKAIAQIGVKEIDCFEINSSLQKALELQEFNLIGDNFLSASSQPIYDRIIANPPFSNNGVANHTQHAFKFLKPGGRLITLAHHYNLKPSNSDLDFFNWLKLHQARFLNLGTAFQNADRKTNTPLQLVLIHKP